MQPRDVSTNPITVRPVEEERDATTIRKLVERSFGRDVEAQLVDDLRDCGMLVLERVAVVESGTIVGHIAYSRVTGAGAGHRLNITCLAPVCVEPKLQRHGIGAQMIRETIDDLQGMGEDLVLVLGDPNYYPRFGFDAEVAKKVRAPFAGPIFMALPLTQLGREGLPIEVSYATPFQKLG
ncbi:GNAT family N-acetyltransferase [Pseudovibrio exalbescens]|uniref:GNAT family acetyltransferase n=1 Tax=Pseudovibrio exalbescens TaxID=197461 RepID=A0A1U7JHM5_9HYPH|nr:N-acetyltransferase [Pseudovibrio exalbescens]OKL44194.1 GNAT family acetyltransferase [Pseudovibrio exalbescens]